jgi:serine/threonine protein phosphatase 1
MANTNRPPRTIAIGDIHGCIHALETLIDAVCPKRDDTIVVLGDFIDQGWESRAVIDLLIRLRDVCQLVCVKGNHEEMMLSALSNPRFRPYWEDCGGATMLHSYHIGAGPEDIPPHHVQFVADCVDYLETDQFIFAHAGFDPELPMPRQSAHWLRWSVLDPNTARCHMSGKTAIVGHTEQRSGEILDLGCIKCIDTGCWRYGWLSGLDVTAGRLWQVSRFGQLRRDHEAPVGPLDPAR